MSFGQVECVYTHQDTIFCPLAVTPAKNMIMLLLGLQFLDRLGFFKLFSMFISCACLRYHNFYNCLNFGESTNASTPLHMWGDGNMRFWNMCAFVYEMVDRPQARDHADAEEDCASTLMLTSLCMIPVTGSGLREFWKRGHWQCGSLLAVYRAANANEALSRRQSLTATGHGPRSSQRILPGFLSRFS